MGDKKTCLSYGQCLGLVGLDKLIVLLLDSPLRGAQKRRERVDRIRPQFLARPLNPILLPTPWFLAAVRYRTRTRTRLRLLLLLLSPFLLLLPLIPLLFPLGATKKGRERRGSRRGPFVEALGLVRGLSRG